MRKNLRRLLQWNSGLKRRLSQDTPAAGETSNDNESSPTKVTTEPHNIEDEKGE
jgi:hypothetical protein